MTKCDLGIESNTILKSKIHKLSIDTCELISIIIRDLSDFSMTHKVESQNFLDPVLAKP